MSATRTRRRWPWVLALVLALLLVALVALAWWFPARWAWYRIRDNYPAVHVGQVGGTLWRGHIDSLVVGGQRLGTLHWTLGRAAVLGHVHGSVDLRGAGVTASGRFQRLAHDTIVIRDARFEVPMTRLSAFWPAGMRLEGQLQGTITVARLVSGWPSRLDARVGWHAAAVRVRGRRVALGDWLSRWQASGGTVVTAQLRDAGDGPVALQGSFTGTPVGWRLDASLTPRHDEPGLRRLLRRIGKPAPDGTVHVERRGGLMAQTAWQ